MSNVKVTNLLHGSSASNNITLASDGTTTIPTVKATTQVLVGGVSSTANGGTLQISNGITFPATQSACSDANTLDDYEEGTWTPVVGGTATYSTQVGIYTKIGRVVSVNFDIAITTLGTGSTTTISGLPFTVSNSPNGESRGTTGYFASLATNVIALHCYANANSTTIKFISTNASTGTATIDPAIFGNSARVQGSVIYIV